MPRRSNPRARKYETADGYTGPPVPLPDGSRLRLRPGRLHWYVLAPDAPEGLKARLRLYLAGHPLVDDRSAGCLSEEDARAAAEDFAAFEGARRDWRGRLLGAPRQIDLPWRRWTDRGIMPGMDFRELREAMIEQFRADPELRQAYQANVACVLLDAQADADGQLDFGQYPVRMMVADAILGWLFGAGSGFGQRENVRLSSRAPAAESDSAKELREQRLARLLGLPKTLNPSHAVTSDDLALARTVVSCRADDWLSRGVSEQQVRRAGQLITVADWLADEIRRRETQQSGVPPCPSAYCPHCSGEICEACGKGTHTDPDRPPCEHGTLERHYGSEAG